MELKQSLFPIPSSVSSTPYIHVDRLEWGANLHKQRLNMTTTEYYDQLLDSCIYVFCCMAPRRNRLCSGICAINWKLGSFLRLGEYYQYHQLFSSLFRDCLVPVLPYRQAPTLGIWRCVSATTCPSYVGLKFASSRSTKHDFRA